MPRLWLVILILALAAGAVLRFGDLDGNEMSADEAATWAAAAAPSVRQVIALGEQLNPGKIAAHEVLLHGWIAMFGDGIVALRALSALFGTLSILLVFWVGRELLIASPDQGSAHGLPEADAYLTAAIAALIFAVSLVMLKYSRELRMYSMMLAVLLAQLGFFVRATRRGGIGNYIGAGVLAGAAVTVNFFAILIPASEAIWVVYLLARSGFRPIAAESRHAWAIAIALAIAGAAFAPLMLAEVRNGGAAVDRGMLQWIGRPALWEPISLFNKAAGSFTFPVLAVLAVYGAVRGWRIARDAVAFALVWMWAPVIMMMIASYAVAPVLVERYVLSCFVPLFFLAAIGVCELRAGTARGVALAAIVALSLGHIWSYARKPHDIQWREATAIALKNLAPGATLSARPAYAVEVVRYYLPLTERERAQRGGSPAVLLLEDRSGGATQHPGSRRDFPVTIAQVRGVVVLKQ
ncbi:MAG: glycosyltransferase family 39 protein [Candidatus Binataceae bacterium]